jgi:hypothetical protein
MSQTHIVIVLVGISSLLALGVGVRVLGLSAARVPAAVALGVETVGFGIGFFLVNVTIGFTTVLIARALVGFASLYLFNDLILLVASLFQGLVFAGWRRS